MAHISDGLMKCLVTGGLSAPLSCYAVLVRGEYRVGEDTDALADEWREVSDQVPFMLVAVAEGDRVGVRVNPDEIFLQNRESHALGVEVRDQDNVRLFVRFLEDSQWPREVPCEDIRFGGWAPITP